MKKAILVPALVSGRLLLCNSCQKEFNCEYCLVENTPPVAIAGTDQLITLPQDSVLLDGSASNDPDGIIRTW